MSNLPPLNADQDLHYFDKLEAVYMDPLVRNAIDVAKTYNQLTMNEYLTYEEISEIVNEIDEEWATLLDETAIVTGEISFVDVDDESDNAVPFEQYHENQQVKFKGIVARPLKTAGFENDTLDSNARCTYELRVQVIKEGLNIGADIVIMTGSAALNSLIKLEFENSMSVNRSRAWLEYFHPDIIEDIDIALLNPSLEECQMVMNLQQMQVDLSSVQDISNEMFELSKGALGVYTASLFNFDNDVPYTLQAEGDAWLFNEHGELIAKKIDAAGMAKVSAVVWQPGTGDDSHIVRPLLDVEFLSAEKDLDSLRILIPIDIVDDFASIRYDYHFGYPEILDEE